MSTQTIRLPDPALDGSWRADTYGAKLVPARNGKGFEDLRLFEKKSLAFYGSFDNPSLRSALRHSLSWIHRQREALLGFGLNRFGLMDELSDDSSDLANLIHDADYETTIELLSSLLSYGRGYAELLRESGLSWSPNGRYIVALIPLSSDELDLQDIRAALVDLVALTDIAPIRPIFFVENPRRMPAEIQQTLSWQAFIGQDQLRYGRDRYPMEPSAGMSTRVTIGMVFDRTTDSTRILNSLSYEPTAESLERKDAVAKDAANYKIFLEGLTDGS